MSHLDYVEQLTFLLFLTLADERTGPPFYEASRIPAGYHWPSLLERDGDALETQYSLVLWIAPLATDRQRNRHAESGPGAVGAEVERFGYSYRPGSRSN